MKKLFILLCCLLLALTNTKIVHGFAPDGFYLLALTWCAGRKPNNYYLLFIAFGLFKDIAGFYFIGHNVILYTICCFIYLKLLDKFKHQTYLQRWLLFSLSGFCTIMPGFEFYSQIINLGWIISMKGFIINLAVSFSIWHIIGYDDSATIGYSRAIKHAKIKKSIYYT